MENTNRSSSHAVFNIKLHIVFVTKYRRKALSPEVLDYLKGAFSDCLVAWNWRCCTKPRQGKLPLPQTRLCHAHRGWCAQPGESIQDRSANL